MRALIVALCGVILPAQIVPQIVPGEGPGQAVPSAEQIDPLRQQVESNPNDFDARLQLATAYRKTNQGQLLLPQLLWLMANRPDSQEVANLVSMGPGTLTPEARAAWQSGLGSALASNSNGITLYAAALFFQSSDASRALELLDQAEKLDPQNRRYELAEAKIYAKAFLPDVPNLKDIQTFSPEQASALKASLQSSSSGELVGLVGEQVATQIRPPQVCPEACAANNEAIKTTAFELLQQAINLQPANPRWQKDLTWAQHIASGYTAPTPLGAEGAVRVGAAVMEANLIRKVEPVYPPLAKAARIQGAVEFTATIDAMGHVANLQLVRGHPLLVNAAKEAVLQWLYRPTLLNGQPVTVMTNVVVNFTLPPAT